MFVRTPQPGLWFIAGSFAQCRIYSKYLALRIKACELGLLPEGAGATDRARDGRRGGRTPSRCAGLAPGRERLFAHRSA